MGLTCASCGAGLQPGQVACPFCQAPTPFGQEQHAQEQRARQMAEAAQAAAAQQQQAAVRWTAQVELDRVARQSVVWSVVGLLLCLLPIPSLVGLVLAFRARALAREKGFVFPGAALAGIVVGGTTLVMSVAFWIFAIVLAQQKAQAVRALEDQTASKATEATLDRDTACALVQLHLLSHGFASSGETISEFHCDGELTQQSNLATVHDVTFEASNAPHTANATLRRGTRWVVERVADAASSGPAATATGSPAAATKPAASAHPGTAHHESPAASGSAKGH